MSNQPLRRMRPLKAACQVREVMYEREERTKLPASISAGWLGLQKSPVKLSQSDGCRGAHESSKGVSRFVLNPVRDVITASGGQHESP